jgi:hypothetical protein
MSSRSYLPNYKNLHRPQPQPPGDDQFHNLGGAGEDGQAAGVAEEAADAEFFQELLSSWNCITGWLR